MVSVVQQHNTEHDSKSEVWVNDQIDATVDLDYCWSEYHHLFI
jgi:hypothetical protein